MGLNKTTKNPSLSLYYVAVSVKFYFSFLKKDKVDPCTGRTAHRGRRGIALLFLDHYTRRG